MSRLCRLKNASHGDDGKWAHEEIKRLRMQRDELLSELEHCAGVFRRYEQLHLLKCTDEGNDKAHSNGVLAARCETAIASMKGEKK